MLNMWRKYPRWKPKSSGFYLCTVMMPCPSMPVKTECFVDKLFYNKSEDKWIDINRQSAFDGYQVYKHCRATIQENRVYSDGLCDRDDVIAWKKLPRAYGKRKKR